MMTLISSLLLQVELMLITLPQDSDPTANCPGTPTMPEAAPGNLCVYEMRQVNLATLSFFNSDTMGTPTDPNGISIQARASTPGIFLSRGSWAATAP